MSLPIAISELPDFLEAEQIAAYLNVGRQTVYDWCSAGILQSFKIGKVRRVHKSDFVAMLEKSYSGGR